VKGIVITSSSGTLQLKCKETSSETIRLNADSYLTATRVQ
jgi:hypothetical protein